MPLPSSLQLLIFSPEHPGSQHFLKMNFLKSLAFLSALFFLTLSPGLAQNEYAFLKTEERFVYEPCGQASPDGTFTLFYYHKASRNFFSFDARGEIISKITAPYPLQLQQEKPLGIHETEEKYHYFFQSSTHRNSLEVISLGKHTASQTFSLLPLTTHRQEKFLQTLSLNGRLFFLLMNRRRSTLILVKPSNGKELERYEFPLSAQLLREIRKSDFSSISGEREAPFSSLGTAKAYLPKENKLLLTIEHDAKKGLKEKGITGILALNLLTEESSFRLLYGPEAAGRRHQTNTLLFEDKLIKVSAGKRFFYLAFYSFPALEKQKEFFYSDTSEISLIQRKLVLREGDKPPRYVERRERKDVLKSLRKGTLAVKARKLDGATLQLQTGTFGNLQSGGAPMMMPMGGGSISAPAGSVSLPVSYGFHSMPGSASAFSRTFETSLTAGSLQPSAAPGPESLEEKEQDLIRSLKMRGSDRLVQLPVSHRKSFLAHYNSRQRLFTFYLISTGDLYKASWNAPGSPDGF